MDVYNIAIKKLRKISKRDSYSKDIQEVKLLLGQYHYGIAAQKELYNKCVELKWIKN